MTHIEQLIKQAVQQMPHFTQWADCLDDNQSHLLAEYRPDWSQLRPEWANDDEVMQPYCDPLDSLFLAELWGIRNDLQHQMTMLFVQFQIQYGFPTDLDVEIDWTHHNVIRPKDIIPRGMWDTYCSDYLG